MWPRVVPLAVDLFLVCLNSILVFFLRFSSGGNTLQGISVLHYLGFLVLYMVLVGVFCQNQGLYLTSQTIGPLDESFSILKGVFFSTLFLATFIYLSGDKSISRLVVGLSGVLNVITLPAWRFWKRKADKLRVLSGRDGRNVLIVGAGDVGQALARYFDEHKYLGYVVKGFLDQNHNSDPRILGKVEALSKLVLTEFIDEVFITIPSERELVSEVFLEARQHHLAVNVVPEMFDGLGWRVPIHYIGGFPVMQLLREPIPELGLFIKRFMDIVLSAVSIIALSPAMALAALVIRLDSPGPAIYRSWRVGWKGRKFVCHKFRTMVTNADALKDGLRNKNERNGPFFKITNDPRLTQIGAFLRRYSLDELPQLWNVLKGDMSLIGPRPHPLDDYALYIPEYLRRLDVKPGITGLWQVYARRDPSFERNLTLDLEYIENWNLWLDVKIAFKTLFEVLKGSGA
ncbi:MAG TPA: sugar transferase [Blastocatellia bacterium]|nr:sugar transferase [Blastocatellia bacterium]